MGTAIPVCGDARADESKEVLTGHEMALRERQLSMEHLLTGVREKFRGVHLPRIIGESRPGTPVSLKIWRQGETRELNASLGETPGTSAFAAATMSRIDRGIDALLHKKFHACAGSEIQLQRQDL